MNNVYVYDHVRTPRGKGRADGALRSVPPVHLAASVLTALKHRNSIDPADIHDVGLGVVMPIGEQGGDLTRTALLLAGYGDSVPGYQLNRFCTSGLDTLSMGAGMIASGQAEAVIGGGVESMSRVGIGSDGGASYTDPQVSRHFPYIPNGVSADLMATLDGVTRAELDSYAIESQRRAAVARESGYFSKSIVPVIDRFGITLLEQDESIRANSNLDDMAKLKPAFESLAQVGYGSVLLNKYPELESIQSLHTSATSSAIVDGACSVLLGNERYGDQRSLRPRARIVATATGASEPLLSLGGPIPVMTEVLKRANLNVGDIDLFEVNEAFAVVPIRVMRHFSISHDRINVNGGAIALGHPLGATGAILLGTVLDELERRQLKRGLITLCAAAGQATAVIIERV